MKPRLALLPAPLHGFLKVSATLGAPVVRLAHHGEGMPVLQIEEAGVVLELEFLDMQCLEAFARQLQPLIPKRRKSHG